MSRKIAGVGYAVVGVPGAVFSRRKQSSEAREQLRRECKQAGVRMPRKIKEPDPKQMAHVLIYPATVVLSAAEQAKRVAERAGYVDVKIIKAEETRE